MAEMATVAVPRETSTRRWHATDARTRGLRGVHVREDHADGKRIWWEDLGADGLEDLVYVERLPLPARVVLVEGEKAADAVRAAGLVGVGTVCGASSTPGPSVIDLFTGVEVTLWPDADPIGFDHMCRIAQLLEPLVGSLRLVDWPDAPAHGDAADLELARIRRLVATAHDVWLNR